ncbi:MAG: amidohydrolase [Candidatus Aminicenantes bacterium]|nr:amidohydrolase [Candidatus Aminicenantes bacterium]
MNYKNIGLVFLMLALSFCTGKKPAADLVFKGGDVYTVDTDRPWARGLVVKGNKIVALLADEGESAPYIGDRTRVVDLKDKLLLPGFIDAHVHFTGFAAQQFDIQLMDVNDDAGLIKEIQRVVENVGPGEWIIGGQWGGSLLWAAGKGEISMVDTQNQWQPHRRTIDPYTADNPCFLSNYQEDLFLANTAALKAAGLDKSSLKGMKLDKSGLPTGLIFKGSPALKKIRAVIKPKSERRLMAEARHALKLLAAMGIVEIHDLVRSFKQVDRWVRLHEDGRLTCRVWVRPWLDLSQEVFTGNFNIGMHPKSRQRDHFLRLGNFKSANDGFLGSRGAMLFEPYTDRPDYMGHYQEYNSDSDTPGSLTGNPEVYFNYCKDAVEHGFGVDSHAIGDRGISEVIDVLERIHQDFQSDMSMFRIIHAEIVQPREMERIKALNLIVETNPSQIPDDMRWLIDRLGPEREKLAFPFRTFLDKGIMMNFGSDVPGNAGAIFYCHPKYVLNAAVNRTDNEGKPQGGWLPHHKISMSEAIRCFTLNGAYGCMREDKIRGSLQTGKLADLVVLDRNILKNDPTDVLNMNVLMTVVDGKVVFEK